MKPCSQPHAPVWLTLIIAILAALMSADALGQSSSDRFVVETSGEGRPVVFIPGLTSSGAIFRDAGDQLINTQNHYVTLAGFGGQPAPENLEAFTGPAAEAIAGYIEAEDLNDITLVGHSMGGVISLMIAADLSHRVETILILDSVPFLAALGDPDADPDLVAQQRPLIEAQFGAMNEEQYLAMMRQGLPVQATSQEAQVRVWIDVAASDQTAVAVAAAEIFSGDFRPILPDVSASVTVMVPYNAYAQLSEEVWLERYETLYDGIDDLDMRLVNDSRHFIMLDQPEIFFDTLNALVGG